MRGLWGNMAKEAVQCELELNNAASNLTAVEGPFYQNSALHRMATLSQDKRKFSTPMLVLAGGLNVSVGSPSQQALSGTYSGILALLGASTAWEGWLPWQETQRAVARLRLWNNCNAV